MALIPTRNTDNIYNVNLSEAYAAQKRIIKEWEPQREVLALRYGTETISSLTALTGFTFNSMFRKSLRLLSHGNYSTNFLVSVAPACLTYISHQYFVTNDLLLYKTDCLLCTELIAVSSMTITGFLYPLIISPAINLPLAGNLGYRIPYIYEVKELAKFFKAVLKPNLRILSVLFTGNTIITGLITYKQFRSMEFIEEILMKVQQYMDDNNLEDLTNVS